MPDEQWGQVPIAFIVLNEQVSVEQLKAFCLQKLAKYKVPKEMIITDSLPRNGADKLLRRKLLQKILLRSLLKGRLLFYLNF